DHYTTMLSGMVLALAESVETLLDDLAAIQPTHLAAVPRFYEKVLTSVTRPDSADRKRCLRQIFGSRIDCLSSGGAPLPLAVAQAYHDAGLLIMQGYGLTENS